ELLALRWADIDIERGRLHVRGTLQRSRAGLTIAEPKTASSRRQIVLSPRAVEALRRHRTRQAEERLRVGAAWPEHDFVFTNGSGPPIDSGNLRTRSFRPLFGRAAPPPIRFHDLRHTAATLLLGEGVHPKIVSEMLGHAQISITLDLYSHVT